MGTAGQRTIAGSSKSSAWKDFSPAFPGSPSFRKRENFRAAFAGFDFEKVAKFGERDVKRCLADAGIVRHRGKIESVINNAKRARELIDEAGSLAAFVWRYEPDPKSRPKRIGRGDILPTSPESIALSKELRQARLVVRRADHGLRLHAGDGAGQRPSLTAAPAGTRRRADRRAFVRPK